MSLLFTDGFEHFDVSDLARKWGGVSLSTPFYGKPPAIVSGFDNIGKALSRKNGRALCIYGSFSNQYLNLSFEKSRTVYVGFALRLTTFCKVHLFFGSGYDFRAIPHRLVCNSSFSEQASFTNNDANNAWKEVDDKSPYLPTTSSGRSNGLVLKSTLTFNRTNVACTTTFPTLDNIPVQVGNVNINSDMYNGEYRYFQFGFTLLGNNPVAGNTSWVDLRVGNRTDKRWFQQCQTCNPDVPQEFFVNGFRIEFEADPNAKQGPIYIDDFYLANDEGDANNDFLGSVYIRSAHVTSQGSINDGEPVNTPTFNRGDAVSGEFVKSVSVKFGSSSYGDERLDGTTDIDSLDVTPSNPFTNYCLLNNEEDEQSFLFSSLPFNGANPHIYACVIYASCLRVFSDLVHPFLVGKMRLGSSVSALSSVLSSRPIAATTPLPYRQFAVDDGIFHTDDGPGYYDHMSFRYPEVSRFVFENKDGPFSHAFSAESVNISEFGFVLTPQYPDYLSFTPALVRKNITLNESVFDGFVFSDATHRWLEESLSSGVVFSDSIVRDWGGSVYESLVLEELIVPANGYQQFVASLLHPEDIIPGLEEYPLSRLFIDDSVVLAIVETVSESFNLLDSSYGWWVEQFSDQLVVVSETVNGIAIVADDSLSVFTSDVFDNHFDVESSLVALSSYVWDNHESCEEYANLLSSASSALIEFVDSLVSFDHEDYDGQWVELFEEQFSLSCSVLTQQWRHEWFFGICINSWQINPIEQISEEGSRVNETDPEVFGV